MGQSFPTGIGVLHGPISDHIPLRLTASEVRHDKMYKRFHFENIRLESIVVHNIICPNWSLSIEVGDEVSHFFSKTEET